VNLNLTDDQKLLRESVAKLFGTESDSGRVRAAEPAGFDPALWSQLVYMGIPLMRVPESRGGLGLGLFEAILVAEEAGRCLASVPLAEALTAGSLLARLDGDDAAALLAQMHEGVLISFMPQELRADEAQVVPGATVARAVLAIDGDDVIVLEGLPREPVRTNLGSSAIGRHVLKGRNVVGTRRVIATGRAARRAFQVAVEEWKLLTAALLVGLAQQALQMAATYSKERKAFGRVIGSFQGIAHPMADAFTEVDGAHLLVWRAVWAAATGRADAGATVSMAYWWATQSAANAATRSLRTFGGYGVSLEYDIQLYYRRAKAWALLNGDPERELYRVAERLWDTQPDIPVPDAGTVQLEFGYGPRAAEFAVEVRQFFQTHLTNELRAQAHHSVSGYNPAFSRQLAQAGLLYPHWPREYGGRDRDPFDMAALNEVFEEFGWERITAPITNQVAQIVMRFGDDSLKQEVLPRFADGSALACLGFSEPSCGSDVFAAKTRAERHGDQWIINGQKIFTTAGNLARYCFLLARTAQDKPKHAGLTLFLVPMDLPGIDVQAVHTIQDERTNITYLNDVRLPDRYRIGEVDGGIKVMAATLELEHGGDQYRINFEAMYRQALRWAQSTTRDGQPAIQDPDVRRRLARVAVHNAVAHGLCYRTIWAITNQVPDRSAFGPMSKVFSTEMYQRDAMDLMDLSAPESLFADDPVIGQIELGYRQSIGTTIYGGTSEIQRSLVAEQGLGMPRSRT
jgi:alkylation response protein AidB-like acyl-CoA dehydrogenase